MNWIVSLDFSSPWSNGYASYFLPFFLSLVFLLVLPNLCEINFSHVDAGSGSCVLGGNRLRFSDNLKEITVDDSDFVLDGGQEKFSDLNNHPGDFLFHQCSSIVLERVSIRNARFVGSNGRAVAASVPQHMLIKFIRNAPPTLKWFRSDLSKTNMDMLRSERP